MLPENDIKSIKYFSANVSARPGDPGQPNRQQTYFRALRTIPELEIHLGHFLSHKTKMRTANPAGNIPKYVEVIKTEEKGSDVNLASHLLLDAFRDRFDVAVLISNDSDLTTPVKMIAQEFNKRVGILNPQEHPSRELKNVATFFKKIRAGVLRQSQFPEQIEFENKVIRKPKAW